MDTRVVLGTLALAGGSLDVAAFLRLGGVFAGVMTSNLVFLSLAAAKFDTSLGKHSAIALVGYVVGVAIGSTIGRPSGNRSRLGTRRFNLLLTAELALLIAYAAWWMLVGGRPAGWTQMGMLAVVTVAMGGQSALARELGDPDAGTTYLTGTLTGVVGALVTGHRPDAGALIALAALLVGAAAGALLIRTAPADVPLVAVAAVSAASALSWWKERAVGAIRT